MSIWENNSNPSLKSQIQLKDTTKNTTITTKSIWETNRTLTITKRFWFKKWSKRQNQHRRSGKQVIKHIDIKQQPTSNVLKSKSNRNLN